MRRSVVASLLAACAWCAQPSGSKSTGVANGCESGNGAKTYSIAVRVTTENFEPIGGLQAADFTLTENGRALNICGFAHDRLPASIGIVLDASGSMREHFAIPENFAYPLLEKSSPQDEYFLEFAGDTPSFQCDLTNNLARIRAGLKSYATRGGSAILDATDLGLTAMRRARYSNRALVLVSDGSDNASILRGRDVMRTLLAAPMPIFLVAPTPGPGAGSLIKEKKAETFDLVSISGGFALPIPDGRGTPLSVQGRQYVQDAASKISAAIRSPYVLKFVPARAGNAPDPRKIKVELKSIRPRSSVFVGAPVPSPQ